MADQNDDDNVIIELSPKGKALAEALWAGLSAFSETLEEEMKKVPVEGKPRVLTDGEKKQLR